MKNKTIEQIIVNALNEDCYRDDLTSRILVPADHISNGTIIAREEGTLCGIEIAKKIVRKVDPKIQITSGSKDGSSFKMNTVICRFKGPTRSILTAERTALNFLGHLSGITTATKQYVKKCQGTKAKVLDTRKTTPNLRSLEKYAVTCGGGVNHRFDLSDMVLIKDNHRETTANRLSLNNAIRLCRKNTRKKIEIEVDDLVQLKEAMPGFPDMILLDNMSIAQLKKAVNLVKTLPAKKRPLLEASGGITLKNINAVARTGVDRISIGALTHSCKSINFSLELKS